MPLRPHLAADYDAPADLFADARASDMFYFLLNIGDGDCQLIVLPESGGRRDVIVVDVGVARKLPRFLDALDVAGHLGVDWSIQLLTVTHPHADHVNGVPDLLDQHGVRVREAWDAAYFHSGKWQEFMYWLEDHPRVRRLHPTSGTRRHLGSVAVTALSPSTRLRNSYDTYGVKLNNASISMLIEFPIDRVFNNDAGGVAVDGRADRKPRRERLLLGGDAQTYSWSHVEVDYPTLKKDHDPRHRALGQANGSEPLGAEIFKVPHHLSKHGLNLELVERIGPYLSLAALDTPGKYGFPHDVAIEQLREAIESTATGRRQRTASDAHLGIFTTADTLDDAAATLLGTIAVRIRPGARRLTDRYRIWRLLDAPKQPLDQRSFANAQRYIGPIKSR